MLLYYCLYGSILEYGPLLKGRRQEETKANKDTKRGNKLEKELNLDSVEYGVDILFIMLYLNA